MKSRFNVDIKQDEVFSLIGSKEGIANLIRELINPTTDIKNKDIILIPDPGYASYGEMVKVYQIGDVDLQICGVLTLNVRDNSEVSR